MFTNVAKLTEKKEGEILRFQEPREILIPELKAVIIHKDFHLEYMSKTLHRKGSNMRNC